MPKFLVDILFVVGIMRLVFNGHTVRTAIGARRCSSMNQKKKKLNLNSSTRRRKKYVYVCISRTITVLLGNF